VVAVTAVVVMVKLADDEVAGITTELGTDAAELALDSVTATLPEGAVAVRVTVPVAFCPPVMLDGFNTSELKLGCAVCAGL